MSEEKKNDGGPAYPIFGTYKSWDKDNEEYQNIVQEFGMSLRDWFAGLAMQAMLGRVGASHCEIPSNAYQMADAMLKARGES